jgi:hypothetical protein
VGWFVLAAGWLVACRQFSFYLGLPVGIVWPLAAGMIGLISAEHARKAATGWPPRIDFTRGWLAPEQRFRVPPPTIRRRKVVIEFHFDLTRTPEAIWPAMADLPHFLTIDPFHERIDLEEPPRAGTRLVLIHAAFGWRFARVGTILKWRPLVGYAFSDLSVRDRRKGFPHVFDLRLTPLPAVNQQPRTRLSVRVTGTWTSGLIPRWLAIQWLSYVSRDHARMIREYLEQLG